MDEIEQLKAADSIHAQQIAAIKAHMEARDQDIDRHEGWLNKLDDAVTMLSTSIANTATREDLMKVQSHIDNKFDNHVQRALDAIPAKAGLVFAALMFLLTLASFLRHG